jgi:hypothetical protein
VFLKYIFLIILIPVIVNSQVRENAGFWKWTTWTIFQTIPSITYFEDRNETTSAFKFGLEWQLIPFSYAFNSNKYVSPFQSFYINPVKRFSGSFELYFQPVYIPGNFENTDLGKFMFKTGGRLILPVAHSGEYLSFSVGGGLYHYKSADDVLNKPTLEAAAYTFYGILGVKYNYNFNSVSRHTFGLYFKYY